ncbi:hypothetical protein [Rhodanobacter sp. Root179]|uniref:hypothetical protein n=1 Tax=Rhodanobacter sp. Root179 TaxID=1736482 RepID=UPI000A3E657B|nr:hypothetical protein [Rhodanobacter sp. Root179]
MNFMLSARKDSWKPRHELGECGGSVDKNTVGLPDFIHAHFQHFLHACCLQEDCLADAGQQPIPPKCDAPCRKAARLPTRSGEGTPSADQAAETFLV